MFSTPILLIIFNRPELTSQILENLKLIEPKYLYIAADGARNNVKSDLELCEKTRALIDKKITWNCEIKKLYQTKNLGCGKAVSSAITWFFENNEYGIILEDDCLPNLSFYSFCENLLVKYKDNKEIMHIGGTNFQNGKIRGEAAYYFSAEVHVWGWASWKRAWKNYDFDMLDLKIFFLRNKIDNYYRDKKIIQYWKNIFFRMQKHEIDTWDYQWRYSIWNAGGLAIIPQKNLISNIGFGENATHTIIQNPFSNMPTTDLDNLIYAKEIVQNKEADNYTFSQHYQPEVKKKISARIFLSKIKRRLK